MSGKQVSKNHAIAALVLGGIELVFGLIIIICSFVLGGKLGNASTTLTPYWAGIPYMIPGILGIVTGITKNHCAMIAFMVLNILCFIIDGIASILLFIVIGIWAAIVDAITNNCKMTSSTNCHCVHKGVPYNYKVDSCSTLKTIVSLMWCIVIFAVISALVSLGASILGCIATCCSGSQPSTVIVQQPVMMQPQPVIIQNTQEQPPSYGQKY